jgi:transcriptional antiterminator RfaH
MTASKNWYVVMTHARSEALAAEHLLRQGFETYMPRIRKQRRHARKIQTVSSPLFPCYVFVAFDQTRQRWQTIRSTFGVAQLLGTGEKPARIPESVLSALRAREDGEGFISLEKTSPFMPGQLLQITSGPFSLCTALVEFMSDNDRVAVLLDLMGRRVRMIVDRMAVVGA